MAQAGSKLHGVVLFTGPTGQGKNTTGRAFLTNRHAGVKERPVGREFEIGHTVVSPSGTGLGFFYDGTNLVELEWIAEGLRQLDPDAAHALPLREQYALRLADRAARAGRRVAWKSAPGESGAAIASGPGLMPP